MELNESRHAGEFILSTASGHRSLENIVIASGAGKLQAGTVLTVSGDNMAAWDEDDSANPATAILLGNVDATDAAVAAAVVVRDAEVNGHQLVWPAEISDEAKLAGIDDLAAAGIIVR